MHSVLGGARCFLYSLAFLGDVADPDSVLVASGTVFGSVVLWTVSLPPCGTAGEAKATETARLGPHTGVIVRLTFSADGSSLCSASDDRSVKVWLRGSDGLYMERHTLQAHLARVWDCVAVPGGNGVDTDPGVVVSCGEDGTCRVWNMESGQPFVSMEGHLGRLWRTCVAPERQLVATGGEDSSIKIWPLLRADMLPHAEESIQTFTLEHDNTPDGNAASHSDSKSECMKCLVWSSDGPTGALLAASAQGKVYRGDRSDQPGSPLRCIWHADGLSFSAAATAGSHGLLLGDVRGRAAILGSLTDSSTGIVWQAHDHRVLAVWWLPHMQDSVFTASPHGEIRMWRLETGLQPSLHATFCCEASTATSALAVMVCPLAAPAEKPTVMFLFGDRKGNLNAFEYPITEPTEQTTPMAELIGGTNACNVMLPRIDGVLKTSATVRRGGRINTITIHRGTAYVLARDGYIVRYAIEIGDDGAVALRLIGKIKAGGGISNIDGLIFGRPSQISTPTGKLTVNAGANGQAYSLDAEGDVFISGFHSTDFVLWNSTRHYQVCRIPCGGGRRPYAVTHDPDNPADYKVAFASERGSTVQLHARQQRDLSAVSPLLSLHSSYHGREVNAVALVRLSRCTSQVKSASSPVVMVTGGEDTMLKVTGHDFAGCAAGQGRGIGQHTLHGHPSAVKALCFTQIDGRWPIVISAGAKEAVMAWQLSTTEDANAQQFNSKLVCRWVSRARSRSSTPDTDTESDVIDHRFHAVTAFPLETVKPCASASHIVAVGGTGPAIDLWCFDEERGQITDSTALTGHKGLALCLAHGHVQNKAGSTDLTPAAFIACGTTNGSVYVWEASGALHDTGVAETSPSFVMSSAHQSGANCLCMHSAVPGQLTIISGGDDQSIHVCTMAAGEDSKGLTALATYRHPLAHVSGLRGMALANQMGSVLLFSTSLDCRLHVWSLTTQSVSDESDGNGTNAVAALCPHKLRSDVLSVADVSALAACTQGTGANVDVVVVGHGLQAFRWQA